MKNTKEKILTNIRVSIAKEKEKLEILNSLKINTTKSGAYHKTITKAGIEIKDKQYATLSYDTYEKKYCLNYYSYSSLYFNTYEELEQERDKYIAATKNRLNKYTEQLEYTEQNYDKLIKKVRQFYLELNANDKELLNDIDHSLASALLWFN